MHNGSILYTYMSVTAISYSTRAHTTCKHCRVKTWDQASLSRLSERDREREREVVLEKQAVPPQSARV